MSENQILDILGDGCNSDIEDFDDDVTELEPTFLSSLAEDMNGFLNDNSEDEMDYGPSVAASTSSTQDQGPPSVTLNAPHIVQSPTTSTSPQLQVLSRRNNSQQTHASASRRATQQAQPRTGRHDQLRHGDTWKSIPFIDKPHFYTPLPINPVRSPLEYIKEYFDDDFYEEVANCTNLYHMRKTGTELKTTGPEIAKLFGIHIIMGCIPFPRLPMYWRSNTKLAIISEKITRDRFTVLRNALHVVDHDTPSDAEKDNPLWKIQPMITRVRNTCLNLERVPGYYSIDEQMIPFTGRCGLRQVVRNKPRPVGLKNFVVTTSNGLMLDFFIYKGAKTMFPDNSLGLGPSVILHLIESIPPGSCIYHDRYFTTVPLIEEMNRRNLHSTGTIMHNRIPDRAACKFKKDSEIIRGESQHFTRDATVIVKWKDNKSVLMASNCTGSSSPTAVRRWDKKSRRYIEVSAPKVIQNYNQHMGGVDILDQQMEYYRTFIKTKKWTLKVLIHFVDLVLVNAWRLYKNDCVANGYPRKDIMALLDFRLNVADSLTNVPCRKRQLTTDDDSENVEPVVQKQYRPLRPSEGKRYDGYDHLPEFDDIKAPRSCMFEGCNSRSKIKCSKCGVFLCLARHKNCFMWYHRQQR